MTNSPSPRLLARLAWLALTLFIFFVFRPSDSVSAGMDTELPPTPVETLSPPEHDQTLLPFVYAQMNSNSLPVYAEPSDAVEGQLPEKLFGAGFVWMSLTDPTPVYQNGHAYYRIRPDGYVPVENVAIFKPSEFQGAILSKTPDKPFGWVVFGTRVSNAPGAAAAKNAAYLQRYTLVGIQEEVQVGNWKWYRIGDNQWVEQRQLGIVTPSARPAEIPTTDKWIDVNLYEQTVAAYEGDRMVYATLASSGLPRWPTPTGLSRIWAKVVTSKMSGREGYWDYYYLEDVPWTMYFDGPVALHGTYWHDRFGAPHSHGCVNLAPKDAHWLFDWTTPTASPGNWTLPKADNPGTWVWVHQ